MKARNFLSLASVALASLCFSTGAFAQTEGSDDSHSHISAMGPQMQNTIYLEILGSGGLYSMNYDRLVTPNLAVRAGISYLGFTSTDASSNGAQSGSASLTTIPVTLSYLLHSTEGGIGSSNLELGIGVMYFSATAKLSSFGSSGSGGLTAWIPTAIIGYRYQPAEGGFNWRIGLTPFLFPTVTATATATDGTRTESASSTASGGFGLWGGTSFGYTF